MNVSLTPQLEQLVQDKVASGLYTSASEVVRAALRLLEQQDRERAVRLKEIWDLVDEGLRDIEEGRVVDVDDNREFFEKIKRGYTGEDDPADVADR